MDLDGIMILLRPKQVDGVITILVVVILGHSEKKSGVTLKVVTCT